MKYIIILAVLFFNFSIARGETTRVTLRSACKNKELISLSTSHFGQAKFLLWKNMEPAENYEQVVKITEKGFYTLIFQTIQYDLFLEPSKDLEIELRTNGKMILKGGYEKLNNLLMQIKQQYPSKDIYREQYLTKKGPLLNRERCEFYAGQYQEQLKLVKKSDLPREEKELATGYVQVQFMKNIYKPIIDSKVFGKADKAEIAPGYALELAKLKPVPEISYYTDWAEFLKELMYTKMQAGKIKLNNPDLWISEWAETIPYSLLRDRFINYLIEREVTMRYFDETCTKRCESAKKMVSDPAIIRKIEANIAKIESTQEAPDVSAITIENTKGERIPLGNFKGKYVFIDIWSTYCNPCIGEMPYLQKLEKELEGFPIEFVSISLDRKRDDWKKFLTNNKMDHNQFIMLDGDKNPIWTLIGLSGIPRFVLIDPDSKVVNKNTYRPSNLILESQLKFKLKSDKTRSMSSVKTAK